MNKNRRHDSYNARDACEARLSQHTVTYLVESARCVSPPGENFLPSGAARRGEASLLKMGFKFTAATAAACTHPGVGGYLQIEYFNFPPSSLRELEDMYIR